MTPSQQREHDEIVDAWLTEEAPLVAGGQGRTEAEIDDAIGVIVGAALMFVLGMGCGVALAVWIGGAA